MNVSSSTEISLLRSVSAPSRRRISVAPEISSAPPPSKEAFLRPIAEETEEERSKPRSISLRNLVLLISSVSLLYVLLYLSAFLLGRG